MANTPPDAPARSSAAMLSMRRRVAASKRAMGWRSASCPHWLGSRGAPSAARSAAMNAPTSVAFAPPATKFTGLPGRESRQPRTETPPPPPAAGCTQSRW